MSAAGHKWKGWSPRRALALALIAAAIAIMYFVPPAYFGIWCLGPLAILVSLRLIRPPGLRAKAISGPQSPKGGGQSARLARFLLAVSLVAAGVSYMLMYLDFAHGAKQTFPVWLFVGSGVAVAISWGYLTVVKARQRLDGGRQ